MGWGEIVLSLVGFGFLAAGAAVFGDWLIGGWREIEALDEEAPPGRSPRWVNEIRKGQRP